jgi:uncharacterized protein YjbJ (UPF0337 family)
MDVSPSRSDPLKTHVQPEQAQPSNRSRSTHTITRAKGHLRQERFCGRGYDDASWTPSQAGRSGPAIGFLEREYRYRSTGYTASQGWIRNLPAATVNFIKRIPQGRNSMKQSSKDQAKGKLHEVKGKVKEKLGRATNNPDLEAEGQDEQVVGTVQKKVGQIEKVFEE